MFPMERSSLRYEPSEMEQNYLMKAMLTYFKLPERSKNRNILAKNVSQKLISINSHWTHRAVRLYFNNNENSEKFLEFRKKYSDIEQLQTTNKPVINCLQFQAKKQNQKAHLIKIVSQNFEYFFDEQKPKVFIDENISIQKESINKTQLNINKPFLRQNVNCEYVNENSQNDLKKFIIADIAPCHFFDEKMQQMREKKQIYKEKKSEISKFLQEQKKLKKSNLIENTQLKIPQDKTTQLLVSQIIYDNFTFNLKKLPNGRRYPDEVIDFFFLIKFGANSYNNLRWAFPIPSEKTLYKRRGKKINEIRNEITKEGNLIQLINMCLKNCNGLSEKVKANLSIDAISIALFKSINQKIKNIFIFFLIPFSTIIKPFTIKALPHENGKANKQTLELIKENIKQLFSEDSPIDLQYIAVDGDYGYNSEFESEFNVFYEHFCKHGLNGLVELIEQFKNKNKIDKLCLFLTDMVHFIKNRRTEIIINNFFMNGIQIHIECLQEILYKSASIMDKSALSKLQDQFPIEIFNFQIFSFLLKCRNDDLSFFFYPIVCWNEAFNNHIIGKKTRLFLLESSLFGFHKFLLIQKKLKKYSEIMPQVALKRAFATISIVYKEFGESTGVFSFAKFGTMLQEHYHGLIRGMAKGVDTLFNTINCISKSNIILDIQNKFELNFKKRTRFSVGGINFDNDKKDYKEIECDFTPQEIIDQLEQLSSYGKNENLTELFIQKLISFSDEIGKGSLRICCTNKHFHYGRKIISREITNHQESQSNEDEDETNFQNEITLINQLLNEEEEYNEECYEEEEEEEYEENSEADENKE